MANGRWPMYIDHINGNPLDNRIENLRECQGQKENLQNHSKAKGYSFCKHYKKWKAYIGVDNKRKTIGYFETEEQAKQARAEAKAKYHTFNPVKR